MPVAERSKAFVSGCSAARTAGSNPAESMDLFLLRLLSVRGLCDGPIPRPEESYQVRVSLYDQLRGLEL